MSSFDRAMEKAREYIAEHEQPRRWSIWAGTSSHLDALSAAHAKVVAERDHYKRALDRLRGRSAVGRRDSFGRFRSGEGVYLDETIDDALAATEEAPDETGTD